MSASELSRLAQPAGSGETFSLAEVDEVLARMHAIASDKRPAFLARIKNILKVGLPGYQGKGRGQAYRYSIGELFLLSTAMEMAQLGLSPGHIARMFERDHALVYLAYQTGVSIEQTYRDVLLTFDPNGLGSLTLDRTSWPGDAEVSVAKSLLTIGEDEIYTASHQHMFTGKSRLAVINVTRMYREILHTIESIGRNRFSAHEQFAVWAGIGFHESVRSLNDELVGRIGDDPQA